MIHVICRAISKAIWSHSASVALKAMTIGGIVALFKLASCQYRKYLHGLQMDKERRRLVFRSIELMCQEIIFDMEDRLYSDIKRKMSTNELFDELHELTIAEDGIELWNEVYELMITQLVAHVYCYSTLSLLLRIRLALFGVEYLTKKSPTTIRLPAYLKDELNEFNRIITAFRYSGTLDRMLIAIRTKVAAVMTFWPINTRYDYADIMTTIFRDLKTMFRRENDNATANSLWNLLLMHFPSADRLGYNMDDMYREIFYSRESDTVHANYVRAGLSLVVDAFIDAEIEKLPQYQNGVRGENDGGDQPVENEVEQMIFCNIEIIDDATYRSTQAFRNLIGKKLYGKVESHNMPFYFITTIQNTAIDAKAYAMSSMF